MTQTELISYFPREYFIPDRVLLIPPDQMALLPEILIQECRVFILVSQGSITAQVGKNIMDISANMLVDMLVWEPIKLKKTSEELKAWCLLPNS